MTIIGYYWDYYWKITIIGTINGESLLMGLLMAINGTINGTINGKSPFIRLLMAIDGSTNSH